MGVFISPNYPNDGMGWDVYFLLNRVAFVLGNIQRAGGAAAGAGEGGWVLRGGDDGRHHHPG
eukprot:55172-Pyramimonas_sp.AAC.1